MKKRRIFWLLLLFLTTLSLISGAIALNPKNPFLIEWDDSLQSLSPGQEYTLKIHFTVPEGHYLYQEKTQVELIQLGGLKLIRTEFPEAQKQFDPFLQKEVLVYKHNFDVQVLLRVPDRIEESRVTLEGEIRFQGCSHEFCYRPEKKTLLVPFVFKTDFKTTSQPVVTAPTLSAQPFPMDQNDSPDLLTLVKEARVDELIQLNPFLLLLAVFLAGVLTDFTPCVLPIIPLTLAVTGIRKQKHLGKNLGISLMLVWGIAATFSVIGVVSAFLGFKLGFIFQSRYFLLFLVFFFLLMSLGMFGFISFELPLRLRNFMGTLGGKGHRGAFLAGISIGFIASPCVGPLLGPLLLLIAKSQNPYWGAVLLFVYGLGMGSIFLVGGTFYSTLHGHLHGGRFSNLLKKILALLLLIPALYYGWVLISQNLEPTGLRAQHLGWESSLEEGLQKAKVEHKPVVVDFFAQWCLPCLELDHKTFADTRVKKELEDFVKIKIDCTTRTSACSEAEEKFEVVGYPTILFLDADQHWLKNLNVIGGFVGPEKMLGLLKDAKK